MEYPAHLLPIVAAVPLKPFAAAKRRLAATLSEDARRRISQELAHRTIAALREAGAQALVLAADDEVAAWAQRHQIDMTTDHGSTLNGAATAAVTAAAAVEGAWLICHADLPLIRADVLAPVMAALAAGRPVITPSPDGGTNLLGSARMQFDFAYGPGSYHHHLRSFGAEDPLVTVDPALALDLDQPDDWRALSAMLPWLARLAM